MSLLHKTRKMCAFIGTHIENNSSLAKLLLGKRCIKCTAGILYLSSQVTSTRGCSLRVQHLPTPSAAPGARLRLFTVRYLKTGNRILIDPLHCPSVCLSRPLISRSRRGVKLKFIQVCDP